MLISSALADVLPPRLWKAWYDGSPVPGTLHSIKLDESSEPGVCSEEARKAEVARSVDALYGDARRWWDEGKVFATRGQ